jgi:hypothetical protein
MVGLSLYPLKPVPLTVIPGSMLDEKSAGKIEANLFTTLFDTAREHARQNVVPPTASLDSYLTAPGSPLYTGLNEEEQEYVRQMSHFLDGWTGASLDKVSLKYWGQLCTSTITYKY